MVTTREAVYLADGLTMVGHLARPDGEGPWPAVLLAHDGVGLDAVWVNRSTNHPDYKVGYWRVTRDIPT